MKHKYLLIPLLALSISLPAYANEGNGNDRKPGFGAELRASFEAKRMELDGLRKEATDQKHDARPGMKNRAEVLTRVYNATVAQLENIASRIDSRIVKMKAEGVVTTTAETHVAAARTDIADAKIHITAFSSLNITGTTTASTTVAKARTEAQAIKAEFKSAHEHLKEALAEIKNLAPKKEKKEHEGDER